MTAYHNEFDPRAAASSGSLHRTFFAEMEGKETW